MSDWQLEACENDLGDANHRWSWVTSTDGARDIMWGHQCKHDWVIGRVDVSSGERHTLVSEDPLHVEASILCVACGDHGFIRDGKWVAA